MTHVETRQPRPEKETIHSGQFMVSHFEAEGQEDDFDDLAVPVPDEEQSSLKVAVMTTYITPGSTFSSIPDKSNKPQHQVNIETSLTKLFKCMTLAYR